MKETIPRLQFRKAPFRLNTLEQRGQISVEYLVIVAIAIAILIPGVLFFYSYSQTDTGSTTQLNDIGLRAIATVKETYALGTGTWRTFEFIMPESVIDVYVDNSELVFVYETPHGISEAVFFSTINMASGYPNGRISPEIHSGITKYRLVSQGQTIFVNETT